MQKPEKGSAVLTNHDRVSMSARKNQPQKSIHILDYVIASSDMRYVEEAERSVWIRPDPHGGFTVQGEFPDSNEASAVNLAVIFLEYAMSIDQPTGLIEAYRGIGSFAERLGQVLVEYINQNLREGDILQRAGRAITSVLFSMDAQFTTRKNATEIHFDLDRCPVCEASRQIGIQRDLNLAHHGINVLCKTIVNALDPGLSIKLPQGPLALHSISIVQQALSGKSK